MPPGLLLEWWQRLLPSLGSAQHPTPRIHREMDLAAWGQWVGTLQPPKLLGEGEINVAALPSAFSVSGLLQSSFHTDLLLITTANSFCSSIIHKSLPSPPGVQEP